MFCEHSVARAVNVGDSRVFAGQFPLSDFLPVILLNQLQVNGCSGNMGKAVIKAAESAGLHIVPMSFGSAEEAGQTVEICGKEILVHGPADRVSILSSVFNEYPDLIVVDYTVPNAVNGNSSYNLFFLVVFTII